MVTPWADKVAAAVAAHTNATARVAEEGATLRRARTVAAAAVEARTTATGLAAACQRRAHGRLAGLVTRCLAAVFPTPYTFDIQFERKRGRTEPKMVFLRNGHEVDPLRASGGGAVDVAAFALRLANLCQAVPARRRLLVLDEPFHFVHGYLPQVGALVTALARELGVQFIIVTQIEEFQTGKVIRL